MRYLKQNIAIAVSLGLLAVPSCAERPGLVASKVTNTSNGSSNAETATQVDPLPTTVSNDTADQVDTTSTPSPDPAITPETSTEPDETTPVVEACVRQLKVMTFNLKNDAGDAAAAKDVNGWNNEANPRKIRMKTILDKWLPDIMGTQEGKDAQINNLKEFYPQFNFWGVGRDDGAKKGEYAGIFYKKDLFKFDVGGHFWLSKTPDKAGTTFAGESHSRMVSWARLKEIKSGVNYLVVNTHWALTEDARKQSAELMVTRIKSVRRTDDKMLILGDFNSFENKVEMLTLFNDLNLKDSFRQVHTEVSKQECSAHGFKGVIDGRRIDFVMIPPGSEVKSAEIIRDKYKDMYPSDHYPVMINLCIPQ